MTEACQLCQLQSGWLCEGSPSVCYQCGDGIIDPTEECDDGDHFSGNGCSDDCKIEETYTCSGEPSVCYACGNLSFEPANGEECDTTPNVNPFPTNDPEGCLNCVIQEGYLCENTEE